MHFGKLTIALATLLFGIPVGNLSAQVATPNWMRVGRRV
jgi:hypothetical protein